MATTILNQGQQEAADGFFQFLLSDEKEFIISGAAGTGKTFLMGYLIDEILPRYHKMCQTIGIEPKYFNVYMTATTNKAAEVLSLATKRETQTIHNLLGLIVFDNYETGDSVLKRTKNWKVISDSVIFIDECSMIHSDLYKQIQEGTINSKIVYVGDHNQLAPVKELIAPIYRKKLPFYELTEPMRNNNQPALQAICQQLRDTINTNVFNPIVPVPGVIDYYDGSQMEQEVINTFKNPNPAAKIVAYTNGRVCQYNDYIKQLRKHSQYEKGEYYINNNAVELKDKFGKASIISVEDEVQITKLGSLAVPVSIDSTHSIEAYPAEIITSLNKIFDVLLVKDRDEYVRLIKFYQKNKRWREYFLLKNTFPDLRPRDASTVHKAQGSTYDTVFIDLEDISTCRVPKMAARLLYVAFSRARTRVVLYGDLKPAYGGIKCQVQSP